MRWLFACLTLLLALPAGAAPLLVVSFDARITTTLTRALLREGGDVVAYKSAPPRLQGLELTSYLEELVFEHEPKFVVMVARRAPQGRAKVTIANSIGHFVGSAST